MLNRRLFSMTMLGSGLGLPALSAAHAATTGAAAADSKDAAWAIVDYCLNTRFQALPPDVVRVTKMQILDTMGIGLGALNQSGVRELREMALEYGGKEQVTLWGTNRRVPAPLAALVNGTMAHALDYDDTHERSYLHPAVITVPAAFAALELRPGITGQEMIAAVATGVNVACRMGLAGSPGVDGFKVGWHSTSVYGYFSSVLVAGKLLRLPRETIVNALGIVLHQAAGNAQAHLDGALTKRMGPGFGAHAALQALYLSQKGVNGARGVIDGRKGLYGQYHGGVYDRSILVSDLAGRYENLNISFKPWPSCRGSHTAADAALKLFGENRISTGDVARITIANGPGEFPLLNAPLARKRAPQTVVDAQFSNPWVVAVALRDGRIALEHFTDSALKRQDILEITSKIDTVEDAALARPGGGPGAARITARLVDGRVVEKTVHDAFGEPNYPMTDAIFEQKFADCVTSVGMSKTRAADITRTIRGLEQVKDMSAVVALMGSISPA